MNDTKNCSNDTSRGTLSSPLLPSSSTPSSSPSSSYAGRCLLNCLHGIGNLLVLVAASPLVVTAILFLAAPVVYFGLRYFGNMKELRHKYRTEGYRLPAQIVSRRKRRNDRSVSYFVTVRYRIPPEYQRQEHEHEQEHEQEQNNAPILTPTHHYNGDYTKELQVPFAVYENQRETHLDVQLLPGYDRSAILADGPVNDMLGHDDNGGGGEDEEEEGNRNNETNVFFKYFAIIWATGESAGWYFGVFYADILSIFFSKGIAFGITVFCLVGAWIAGYFLVRRLRDCELNFRVQGAKPVPAVVEQQDCRQDDTKTTPPLPSASPPRIRYMDMFPASVPESPLKTVLVLLASDIFDLFKMIIVLCYTILFGMTFFMFHLILVNWFGRYKLMNKYAEHGELITGRITSRRYYPESTLLRSVTVQYSPHVESTEVYKREFPEFKVHGRLCCCGHPTSEASQSGLVVPIPYPPESDTNLLNLYILPNQPRSARPVLDVENRNAVYRKPSCGLLCCDALVILLYGTVQSLIFAVIVIHLLEDRRLLPVAFAIHVATSLILSFVVQMIRRARYIKDIVNGADLVENHHLVHEDDEEAARTVLQTEEVTTTDAMDSSDDDKKELVPLCPH